MEKTLDFESSKTFLALSPRHLDLYNPIIECVNLNLDNTNASIIISSSGTSSQNTKYYCLSKNGILDAAKSVNNFLNSSKSDIWGLCLPDYHIAGLSILARSFVSGAKIIQYNQTWSAIDFYNFVEQNKVSITSLTPLQVYDLVYLNKEAPKTLNTILVGAGSLEIEVFEKAQKLKYKLICSFGMTESSAMFAYRVSENHYKKLDHIKIKSDIENHLYISGESVAKYAINVFKDNSIRFEPLLLDNWYKTNDMVSINDDEFNWLGRSHRTIKHKGSLVNLDELKQLLVNSDNKFQRYNFDFLSIPDSRETNKIILISNTANLKLCDLTKFLENSSYHFVNISEIVLMQNIPLTSLGKINESEIKSYLKINN
jgi:acyl-CoA synthetase (AMP-forming)/AMP-acid ligase II